MNLTPERLIILGLAILLFVAILVILKISKKKDGSYGEDVGSRGFVPKEKHFEILRERDDYRDQLKLLARNSDIQEKYEKACVEISNLKNRIDELTRDNNELNVLYHKESLSNGVDEKIKGANSEVDRSLEHEKPQERIDGQIIKYSSFPRSAGSTIYFSDLTDKLVDDSYFELRISGDTGIASFRPLDFMKIRNYDPAMAAILTDGVKPNVASTVVGIESGNACLEGNDWIINKLAKVKLA